MNYVGRLLSNFKGFYNEINSATLTGAIDVVVVKQADGSLISSPFHVRFGKMGVLRSREKVVDIEINGHAVDLHMKLGEQGEAFFVHNASEEGELPEYLATSPIPESMSLMEAGIREMKLHQMAHPEEEEPDENEVTRESRSPEDDTKTLVDADRTPTEGLPKDDSIASFISLPKKDSSQSLYQSVHTSFDVTPDRDDGPVKADMAVQTEVTGDDVEVELRAKSPDLYEIVSPKSSSGESGKDEETRTRGTLTKYHLKSLASDLTSDTVIDMDADSTAIDIDESHTPKAGSPLSRSHPRLIHSKSPEQISQIISSPDESQVVHESVNQRRKRRKKLAKKKELMVAKMSTSSTGPGDDSGSSLDGYTQDLEVFDMDLSDQDDIDTSLMGSVSHSTSMPLIADKSFLTNEWAQSQYASAFHPFSDGDITPVVSPCSSRPPSPKSDTEFEMQKNDMGAQTQLTGNNFEDVDQVNWQWGQLPQSSGYKEDKLKSEKELNDEKPSSGLFHFMRSTKKIRHKPQEEGIYLDDLDLNEMDPEVVALYLTHPKSGGTLRTIQDEDTESGRGASLPQSPVSMMTDHQDRLGNKGELGYPKSRKFRRKSKNVKLPQIIISPSDIPDIALSLCGGLKDVEGDISHERFMQFLITYDEFVENPLLISNPDLVIRMGEKYYNWSVAGPMLLSAVAFQRPLPEYGVENLIKKHMPKKERRRGWIWWRTVDDDPKSLKAKEETEEAESSEASSPPNGEPKGMRRHTVPALYGTEEESEIEESLDMSAQKRSHDMYRKSLKLTSDELMQLNLVEGRNEVTFSVTTQYQGTCSCSAYIYLWKWDDRIVVSDIDGTITRSDVLGQLLPMVGKDWSQAGITHLYSMIHRNGYKFVYLSARAIGQSKTTRDYLRSVRQGDTPLPEGPLLLSPSSLISAFHREVIERKPEEFKISCLRDLAVLFPHTRNPFYAGYGNKINDVWAYRAVGIPISRIFTVNHKGELRLELSHTFMSSYTKLSDVVDHFFPPLVERDKNKGVKVTSGYFPNPHEYSSFTYWREPLPDIENEIVEFSKS